MADSKNRREMEVRGLAAALALESKEAQPACNVVCEVVPVVRECTVGVLAQLHGQDASNGFAPLTKAAKQSSYVEEVTSHCSSVHMTSKEAPSLGLMPRRLHPVGASRGNVLNTC